MAHTGNKRRSGGLFARGPGTSWLNSDSSGCASWQRPHRQTPSWWAHPAHHCYPPLSGERGEVAVRSTANPQMVSMCPQGLSDSAHPTGTFIQPMAHILMVQCFYHYLKLDIKCPLSGTLGEEFLFAVHALFPRLWEQGQESLSGGKMVRGWASLHGSPSGAEGKELLFLWGLPLFPHLDQKVEVLPLAPTWQGSWHGHDFSLSWVCVYFNLWMNYWVIAGQIST